MEGQAGGGDGCNDGRDGGSRVFVELEGVAVGRGKRGSGLGSGQVTPGLVVLI